MEIVILAEEVAFDFLKTIGENITWKFTNTTEAFFASKNADAYFDLRANAHADYSSIAKPVFINSMAATLAENNHNKNIIRINAWPGFISARIIAMIINEAYYALDEKVSSKTDIDIAMKLGTNYPYGPFEWCNIIGVQQVYQLLAKLSLTDERFLPSAGIAAANTII